MNINTLSLGPSLIGIIPYAGIDLTIYESLKLVSAVDGHLADQWLTHTHTRSLSLISILPKRLEQSHF